ncbi:MAG: DUF5941 domain-containing protein, partial [Stackebrandtia sp.]
AGLTARHPHSGPLDWLTPAGLRAGEFGVVVICGLAGGVPAPLTYGLLGVLALYHYDLAARIDKSASPMSSRGFGLGWDGRLLVLLVGVAVPASGWTTWVFALLTAHVAVVFLAGTLAGRRAQAGGGKPNDRPMIATAPVAG